MYLWIYYTSQNLTTRAVTGRTGAINSLKQKYVNIFLVIRLGLFYECHLDNYIELLMLIVEFGVIVR